jgi:hypothetical protein
MVDNTAAYDVLYKIFRKTQGAWDTIIIDAELYDEMVCIMESVNIGLSRRMGVLIVGIISYLF